MSSPRLDQIRGAQVTPQGTEFSVWAPAARDVSVVVEQAARRRRERMERGADGVWRALLEGVGQGARYLFQVTGAAGETVLKADPLARAAELRPSRRSVVTIARHEWRDQLWMQERFDPVQAPMSVYEVHPGSWREAMSYLDLAEHLVAHVLRLGFTHIELMGILEHPLDASWGYQVTGYFAPTSRYGEPDELRAFVDCCHRQGVGVILDWVPAHFPKDDFGLGRFDGTALYEHPDPLRGEHRQWGTYVFDYGKPEVRRFLRDSALYWLEEFHVDGLRCDAVASMIYLDYAATTPDQWAPNVFGGREHLEAIAFLQELTEAVRREAPAGAFLVAEESTAWPGVTHPVRAGGLGFSLKWNMGWMHDTLGYFSQEPSDRREHHDALTFGLLYAFDERYVLPLSHDEVVHEKRSLIGKLPGDRNERFANLRALYAHMWAHPGKKLLFMGAEIALEREWSEALALDWSLLGGESGEARHGVMRLVRALNQLYREYPQLARDHDPAGFRWVEADDRERSVVVFSRHDGDRYLLCVGNFGAEARAGYRVGVSKPVVHREILNTDASVFGGENRGNLGEVVAEAVPAHGFAQSLSLTLPPLTVLYLTPTSSEDGGAPSQ